nr:hypothetical transcript [Hymenolepis microstoma]
MGACLNHPTKYFKYSRNFTMKEVNIRSCLPANYESSLMGKAEGPTDCLTDWHPTTEELLLLHELSLCEQECAIDLTPRGAPWATYTHVAEKSINWQLTSNYHDSTVCHIRPLPQYLPHLILFSTFVSVSFTSVKHTSVPLPPSRLFDVPPLCEA